MIPLKLKIKGVYSYQQETEIDFRHLTAAGLFGIFGSVGSGKSTILEAISFALYGETERMNSKEGRNYNMMNLRSNELLIDFEFSSGEKQTRYRFIVSGKRNRRNFGNVGTFSRSAYKYENGSWQPIQVDAEAVIGLSYQNFKRTIIIPQGKFQEFLQLSDAERTRMLREIFNLQKFELSDKVARLEKINTGKINNLQGQLIQLQEPNDELLKQKRKAIDEVVSAIKAKESLLDKRILLEKEQDNLSKLFRELEQHQAQLELSRLQKQGFDSRAEKLSVYENCYRVFANLLENRDAILQKTARANEDKKRIKNDFNEATELIESLQQKKEILKEAYEKREELLQKAQELGKLAEVQVFTSEIELLKERIQNGDIEVKKKVAEQKQLQEDIRGIKNEILELKKSMPDASMLARLNTWFDRKSQFQKEMELKKKELFLKQQKAAEIKTGIEEALLSFPLQIKEPWPDLSYEKLKLLAGDEISGIEKEQKLLEEKISHWKVTEKLEEFANELKPGESCPLCGSQHHPGIFSADDVHQKLEENKANFQQLGQKKERINSSLNLLNPLFSTLKIISEDVEVLEKNASHSTRQMNRHIEAFSFDGYSPEDESRARDAMQSLSEKQSKLDLLGEKLESKAVLLETTVSELEKFRGGIETLKNKQSAKNAEVRLLKNQVVKLKKEEFMELPGDKLRLQQEDFSRQYQQLTLAYDQLEKELQEKVAIKDRLWGQLGEIGKQLENYNSDLKARELKLGELLAVSTFKNEEEVRQVLSYAIDVEKEKTAIANFYNSLHAAEELFKQVSSKAEGKSYDKDEHEVVQKEIREIKQELDARKDELSAYRKILADLERDMQKYRELHAGLEKLNLRAENLRTLSNLFRSSGFVNYVSSVYLHNLLNNANQRFHRLTRQKLMLELTESNNFQVRDFMNNGEVRSVKTLSGGQTFQAALCLALSLADNIQHLTKSSRNFFFLDEGFGSLDKESLGIVFETLKSLRKENRVVGVISHVEEMQQEINAYLQIINDEEKGSLVKRSWLNGD